MGHLLASADSITGRDLVVNVLCFFAGIGIGSLYRSLRLRQRPPSPHDHE